MHFQRSDIFFNYDTVRRNLVQKLEARYPNKTFTIWNGLNTNDSSTETILQKEKVKAPALLLTSNTSLGNLDFSVFYPYNIPRFDSKGTRQLDSSQYRLKPMKENFDAILYLSTWEELNHSDPLPSYVYDDTLYLNELIRKASARKQEFGFKLNMLKFEKVKRSVLFKRFAEALPTGDLTKINATYKELKKHNPDFIASFGIGLAAYDLLENRKYKPAIYAFNLALIEYPNDAYVHAGLGDTYAAIGEKNKAAKTYAEALRLDPNFFEVKTKLEALKSVK
jgi:tetratricopeptide (TPR) repeat protein